MRVFVAGGSGVLGRASLPALVAAGHQVRAMARGSEKAALVRKLGAEPVDVDLFDAVAVRRAVAGSEAVVRLTTKIGRLTEISKRRAWDETNQLSTEGARILVDAALAEGIGTYVHESVTFVYRDGGEAWLAEDAPVDDGGSHVLGAVLAGEQEAARFTNAGGRGIVLRFAGFYGPDAASTLEMVTMARRRMLARLGPSTGYFSSIYVPDAGRAVAASLNVPAGIYNVSDDQPVRLADYMRTLARALKAPPPYRLPAFLGKWMFGEVWSYLSRSQRVSSARLKAASDWTPEVSSVEDGWARIAAAIPTR